MPPRAEERITLSQAAAVAGLIADLRARIAEAADPERAPRSRHT